MLSLTNLPVALVGAALCVLAARLIHWRIRRSGLPPGPPGHVIFGHANYMKSSTLHSTAAEWTRTYGDLVTLYFMDKNTVIVNSAEAAVELLDKRARTTAGRPREVMMGEVMGYSTSVGLHQPNDRFWKLRRTMASALSSSAVRRYHCAEAENVTYLLRRMAELNSDASAQSKQAPSDSTHVSLKNVDASIANHDTNSARLIGVMREASARFILKVAYGYNIKARDPLVGLIQAAMLKIREGRYPLVEAFPWLTKLPSWVPGTDFLRIGAEGFALRNAYARTPFERVKAEMRANNASPSFASSLLTSKGGPDLASEHDQDLIMWSAAVMFVGGSDTISSVMNTFLLLMATNPQVQRAAQAEIASVIGPRVSGNDDRQPIADVASPESDRVPVPARLPGFMDRAKLPYLDAVFKEVLRYNPPLSLGLPHTCTEEETYRGYVFPSGTIVRANLWAILRDPTMYTTPSSFLPERHLGPDPQPNPLRYVFGFGRRICPGLHLVEDKPWLTMAGILSAFDIVPGPGLEDLAKEQPSAMFEFNGMTTQPKPLGFSLKLRKGAEFLV